MNPASSASGCGVTPAFARKLTVDPPNRGPAYLAPPPASAGAAGLVNSSSGHWKIVSVTRWNGSGGSHSNPETPLSAARRRSSRSSHGSSSRCTDQAPTPSGYSPCVPS